MLVAFVLVGLTGFNWVDGEIFVARVVENFGVLYTFSIMLICSIEDVVGVMIRSFWFQFYVMRDCGFVVLFIECVRVAKCLVLVLIFDL